MKKFFVSFLLLAIFIFSLLGCGKKVSTKQSGDLSNNVGGELNVAIWDKGQEPGIRIILDDFTKATGIKTNLQVVTWESYWTLLEAGASGGDMPDVFWMHPNQAQKYMSNNILLDITDMIKNSDIIEIDKFKKDILEMYTYEDKIYGIPKDIDTVALWYNKTMFDELGIPYPDETWTWDKFYKVAKQLTKEDGSQYGTAMSPSGNQEGYYNIIYSMGGSVISDDKTKSELDSENTIKAMEFVQKLISDTMPSLDIISETPLDVLFSSGKVAMLNQGSWMVSLYKENEYVSKNCDVAIIPKNSDGKRVSMYNGLIWAASANTKNKEGALKLLEWFGSKDMQQKQADLGVTMSAYEGLSENWAKSSNFNLEPYLEVLDSDKAELVIKPYSKETVTWENSMIENFKLIWENFIPVKEILQKATEDMNKILASE